jgi:tetratricopeptide (TPR) repeat protein
MASNIVSINSRQRKTAGDTEHVRPFGTRPIFGERSGVCLLGLLPLKRLKKSHIAGVRRIAHEMDEFDACKSAAKYAEAYLELVDYAAAALRKYRAAGLPMEKPEQAFMLILGILDGCQKISYRNNTLDLLIDTIYTKEWTGDNLAFLVHDVARRSGMNVQFLSVPGQILVHSGKSAFDCGNCKAIHRGSHGILGRVRWRYGAAYGMGERVAEYVAHMNIGMALMEIGDNAGAARRFERAKKCDPLNPEPHSILGGIYADLSKEARATQEFAEAAKLAPGSITPMLRCGEMHCGMGRYEKAKEEFTRAAGLAGKRGSDDAHIGLGDVACAQQEYGDAIAHYRKATEINPDNAIAYYKLGGIYRHLGDAAGAERCFREATRIAPNYASAHFDIASMHYERGNNFAAIPAFDRAIGLDVRHSGIRLKRRHAYTAIRNRALTNPALAFSGPQRPKEARGRLAPGRG